MSIEVVNDYDSLLRQAVAKTIEEPSWFYDNILRFSAFKWQNNASHAVLDARKPPEKRVVNLEGLPRVTIRSCHGTGKTQLLGLMTHLHSFIDYNKIAATAPKQAQLTKRLFPNIRRAMRNAVPEWKNLVKVLGQEVKIDNDPDWGLIAETASEPDNLSGLHPPLFMVDEAAARRVDQMYPVIYGALSMPGAILLEIGNPTRVEGEFYKHHCVKGIRETYFKMHIKQEDAPEIITPEMVQNYITNYGLHSPITKIRALGEFAAFDEYILIPLEYIEDALDLIESSDGSHPKLRISVDVADGGQDSTVITAVRHYDTFMQVLKQKQFYFEASKAPILAAKAAKEMFQGFDGSVSNGDDIVVDSIGVGSGTAGWLIDDGQNVITYKGGESSDDTSRWRNRRVQSFIALYEYFRDGRIRINPDAIDDEEEFRAHLLSIKRRVENEKVDDIEPKDKIKQEGLPSPDRADSLAMQCATQTPAYSRSGMSAPELMGTLESANNDASLT